MADTIAVPTSLEQALLSIINSTTQAVGKGIDFLSEQIPDVIHQLLLWEASKAGIIAVCWIALSVALAIISVKLWKHGRNYNPSHRYDEESGFSLFGAGLLAILSAASFCGVIVNLLNIVQIMIAPKIFLIQYAAHLVKG